MPTTTAVSNPFLVDPATLNTPAPAPTAPNTAQCPPPDPPLDRRRDECREQEEEEKGGEELDREIQRWEVVKAIEKQRNGKAGGVDGVVGEILKYGGAWMTESLWRLCRLVFRGEEIPVAWLKAIKVPLRKKGKGERYDDYRGVTLLSVVGKVFGRVIEARLRAYCEKRGLLSDCQYGFRAGRACRDALLIFSEVVERRGGKTVFAGFLDIAKAYPSVWRGGLWKRLLELGVRGRMWRVLRSLYSKYEVGVRVGGTVDEWYEEFVGVREGCVVSPLLFAIYINEIAREVLEKGGGGVGMGEGRVSILMFADDIVIVEESEEALQKSLRVVWEYRWSIAGDGGSGSTLDRTRVR